MLCRAVTGGGFSKRELYSDADDIVFAFKRAVIMTGINVPATEPDLLDRCLLIGLERIPEESRREEKALWREFEAARPALFGALLDALAETMAQVERIHLARLPRMADFAHWGAAAAVAMGHQVEDFAAAMFEAVDRQTEEALESDPVGLVVRDLMAGRAEWEGTATDLLEELTGRVGEKMARTREWPKQANGLSRRLNILTPVLAGVGIGCGPGTDPEGKKRRWLVLRTAEGSTRPSPSSPHRRHPDPATTRCPAMETVETVLCPHARIGR